MLCLVKYSNYNTQFSHNTSVIPITGVYSMLTIMMLGLPGCWEGIRGLKQAQTHCSLRNSSASCLAFYTLC